MVESLTPAGRRELTASIVRLARVLRDRGFALGAGETIDAVRAALVVDLADRRELRDALRAVLASRRDELEAFDRAFDEAWEAPGTAPSPIPVPTVQPRRTQPPPRQRATISLENWMRPSDATPSDSVPMRAASDVERLADRDLSDFAFGATGDVRRLADRIARRLVLRKSRRWGAAARGTRVHLRRLLREAARSGGDPLRIPRKSPKVRKTKLLALCDVSGSMELYSAFLLSFLHALQQTFASVESFVFATRLSHVTGALRAQGYGDSLRAMGALARDWSGGTRIGAAVAALTEQYRSLLDRRTVVLVLSDGWEVGDPAVLSTAMKSLRSRVGRVIWLNPLMGSAEYAPETKGMKAALGHIDLLLPAHNLRALEQLVPHLRL